MAIDKKELAAEGRDELLKTLKTRFEKNKSPAVMVDISSSAGATSIFSEDTMVSRRFDKGSKYEKLKRFVRS